MTSPIEYPSMAAKLMLNGGNNYTLFKKPHDSGFLSILYAIGQRPLDIWEKQIRNGHIKRVNDTEIRSMAIEILATNVHSTFLTTPIGPQQILGISLPIIYLVVKNLKRYFAFEVMVLDTAQFRRRFCVSNMNMTTRIRPGSILIPLKLDDSWNQIQLNLADMTMKAFGTTYQETLRVQIHANTRLRRVYFSDRIYNPDELPSDYRVVTLASPTGTTPGSQTPKGKKSNTSQNIEKLQFPKDIYDNSMTFN